MRGCEDLGFEPNEEVDELAWLEPAEAVRRLSYEHDRELVEGWAAAR
jgi:8-oxo-dGTP diphosphatase